MQKPENYETFEDFQIGHNNSLKKLEEYKLAAKGAIEKYENATKLLRKIKVEESALSKEFVQNMLRFLMAMERSRQTHHYDEVELKHLHDKAKASAPKFMDKRLELATITEVSSKLWYEKQFALQNILKQRSGLLISKYTNEKHLEPAFVEEIKFYQGSELIFHGKWEPSESLKAIESKLKAGSETINESFNVINDLDERLKESGSLLQEVSSEWHKNNNASHNLYAQQLFAEGILESIDVGWSIGSAASKGGPGGALIATGFEFVYRFGDILKTPRQLASYFDLIENSKHSFEDRKLLEPRLPKSFIEFYENLNRENPIDSVRLAYTNLKIYGTSVVKEDNLESKDLKDLNMERLKPIVTVLEGEHEKAFKNVNANVSDHNDPFVKNFAYDYASNLIGDTFKQAVSSFYEVLWENQTQRLVVGKWKLLNFIYFGTLNGINRSPEEWLKIYKGFGGQAIGSVTDYTKLIQQGAPGIFQNSLEPFKDFYKTAKELKPGTLDEVPQSFNKLKKLDIWKDIAATLVIDASKSLAMSTYDSKRLKMAIEGALINLKYFGIRSAGTTFRTEIFRNEALINELMRQGAELYESRYTCCASRNFIPIVGSMDNINMEISGDKSSDLRIFIKLNHEVETFSHQIVIDGREDEIRQPWINDKKGDSFVISINADDYIPIKSGIRNVQINIHASTKGLTILDSDPHTVASFRADPDNGILEGWNGYEPGAEDDYNIQFIYKSIEEQAKDIDENKGRLFIETIGYDNDPIAIQINAYKETDGNISSLKEMISSNGINDLNPGTYRLQMGLPFIEWHKVVIKKKQISKLKIKGFGSLEVKMPMFLNDEKQITGNLRPNNGDGDERALIELNSSLVLRPGKYELILNSLPLFKNRIVEITKNKKTVIEVDGFGVVTLQLFRESKAEPGLYVEPEKVHSTIAIYPIIDGEIQRDEILRSTNERIHLLPGIYHFVRITHGEAYEQWKGRLQIREGNETRLTKILSKDRL